MSELAIFLQRAGLPAGATTSRPAGTFPELVLKRGNRTLVCMSRAPCAAKLKTLYTFKIYLRSLGRFRPYLGHQRRHCGYVLPTCDTLAPEGKEEIGKLKGARIIP